MEDFSVSTPEWDVEDPSVPGGCWENVTLKWAGASFQTIGKSAANSGD